MKASFQVEPSLIPDPKKEEYSLGLDWCFSIDFDEKPVPAGYSYDGASIPRIFWTIIGGPFDPQYSGAALAHDIGYLTHALTRSELDEVFFQLLRQVGVGLWRARIMWAAVRTGGALAWKNTAKDEISLANLRGAIKARPDWERFKWILA